MLLLFFLECLKSLFAIINLNNVSATACGGRQDFKVSGEFSFIFPDVLWTMQMETNLCP